MNFGDIKRKVKEILSDDSFEADIPLYVNTAYKEAVEFAQLSSRKTYGSVNTDPSTYYVSIPATSTGRVSAVIPAEASNGKDISILLGGLEELIRIYGDLAENSGDVEAVAIEGSTLYYQPIPDAAETLYLVYMTEPDDLSVDADIPLGPAHLHLGICVYGALHHAFLEIEQGPESLNQVQSEAGKYGRLFRDAKNRLRAWQSAREYAGKSWGNRFDV